MFRNILSMTIMAGAIAIISACEHDAYETGDGDLSYMHADYADFTISNHSVTSAITDDNTTLPLPSSLTVSSELPADTMLRRLVHYNMKDASTPIEILRLTPVSVVTPHSPDEEGTLRTDPIKLTAAWLSPNKRYLNLQLGIMTGTNTNSDAVRQLRIVCDSTHTGGHGAAFLSLRYDNANTPEYYTQDVYVSIPCPAITTANGTQADTISITVNTYSGRVTKDFLYNKE